MSKVATISEDTLQGQCVTWFKLQFPKLWEGKKLFHIPNGGSRNKIEAVKFKRLGVVSGVSDLFLSIPMAGWSGAFIELKTGNNGLTENQEVFIKSHEGDYFCAVCYTLEEFQGAITNYLSGKYERIN